MHFHLQFLSRVMAWDMTVSQLLAAYTADLKAQAIF
jgi:hypothetical protein